MTEKGLTEPQRARHWREKMGLNRPDLARLSGYSASAIRDFEKGHTSKGKPIDRAAWQRYRLVCGALTARLAFNWGAARVEITEHRTAEIPPTKP